MLRWSPVHGLTHDYRSERIMRTIWNWQGYPCARHCRCADRGCCSRWCLRRVAHHGQADQGQHRDDQGHQERDAQEEGHVLQGNRGPRGCTGSADPAGDQASAATSRFNSVSVPADQAARSAVACPSGSDCSAVHASFGRLRRHPRRRRHRHHQLLGPLEPLAYRRAHHRDHLAIVKLIVTGVVGPPVIPETVGLQDRRAAAWARCPPHDVRQPLARVHELAATTDRSRSTASRARRIGKSTLATRLGATSA